MPLQKVGPFNPSTVDALIQRIHGDVRLKADVLADLSRNGTRAFIEKTFDLDARQREEVDLLQHREFEDVFGRALHMALVNNGSIKVIHEGHTPPDLRMQITARHDDGNAEGPVVPMLKKVTITITVSC
jgi:hypothetical protein